MKVAGGKLDSERVSPLAFGLALAALAALAAWLLWRGTRAGATRALVALSVSPGLAAAGCAVALYYADDGVALTRLASSAVFLQALMICMLFTDGWRAVVPSSYLTKTV
jgi:glycerol-3-phosphate acyltransferase PlsY